MTDPVSLDVHTNPEAHDPDGLIPADIAANEAVEAALASAPRGATVEAKAGHVRQHLAEHGWALIPEAAAAEGNVHVLGHDEQIVTVPDGYQVDVTPTLPDAGHGDLELTVLGDIVVQLEGLDPESRERVAGFVTHRYGPAGPPSPPPTWGQPWYRPVQQAPGLDITNPSRAMDAAIRGVDPEARRPFARGGVIGRPQATRISE